MLLIVLMACIFSTLDNAVTLRHGADTDIGQWPRLLLAASGLAAGFLFDIQNRKYMTVMMYSVMLISVICVVVLKLGGSFLIGLLVFYFSAERLQWQMNAEHRPMFVYVEKSEIIGFYSLALHENGECELNNLCVIPQFRHGGAGGELLHHAFQTAKQLGFCKLNIGIVEENTQLRKWYEKFGFVHIGTQKFDFFPFTCGYMEKIL